MLEAGEGIEKGEKISTEVKLGTEARAEPFVGPKKQEIKYGKGRMV